jgi:hypothetical protein
MKAHRHGPRSDCACPVLGSAEYVNWGDRGSRSEKGLDGKCRGGNNRHHKDMSLFRARAQRLISFRSPLDSLVIACSVSVRCDQQCVNSALSLPGYQKDRVTDQRRATALPSVSNRLLSRMRDEGALPWISFRLRVPGFSKCGICELARLWESIREGFGREVLRG